MPKAHSSKFSRRRDSRGIFRRWICSSCAGGHREWFHAERKAQLPHRPAGRVHSDACMDSRYPRCPHTRAQSWLATDAMRLGRRLDGQTSAACRRNPHALQVLVPTPDPCTDPMRNTAFVVSNNCFAGLGFPGLRSFCAASSLRPRRLLRPLRFVGAVLV